MKRGWKIITVFALAVSMLAGCGAADGAILKNLKVEDYVTLGNYKGMQVIMDAITVDEQKVEELAWEVYSNTVTAEYGITDRAVANGDTVNIDYEGKENGVAFASGTAQDALLEIGSGTFIPGFEEALVGVMPGETVDLDLSFPDDYRNAEMAGKDVVFTVTVNFIVPREMDPAVVQMANLEGVTNEEELKAHCRNYLMAVEQQNYQAKLQDKVVEVFMSLNTISEVPQELLDKVSATTKANLERTAASYGMDAATFVKTYYKTDLDSFVRNYSTEGAKQQMALQAVANAENLNISDKELKDTLKANAEAAGVSVDEYLNGAGEVEFREYLMVNKVMDFLIENANITRLD